MKNQIEKTTKAAFTRHAMKSGLHLVGAPWNITLDSVCETIDSQGGKILEAIGERRDKITGTAYRLIRHTQAGGKSHLHIGGEDTVFRYGEFWLIRGEHGENSNNTVIYI